MPYRYHEKLLHGRRPVYQQSLRSHRVALMTTGKGPNCVTCHGAHDVKKVNINLINPQLCGRCHSYALARAMKAALWKTEKEIEALPKSLKTLKAGLISTSDAEMVLYRTKEGAGACSIPLTSKRCRIKPPRTTRS